MKPTDRIPSSWGTTIGGPLVRLVLIAFWVVITIVFLRLMAWADTGMRGDRPVEKSIIPTINQPTK